MRWADENFDEMSWHDNALYSISFPFGNSAFCLDIDYIIDWILDEKTSFYNFKVIPCLLKFENVSNYVFSLKQDNSLGIYIEQIHRKNKRLTPNSELYSWDYIIETDRGKISFCSTGFKQEAKAEPIYGNSQVYKIRGLNDYSIL